MRRSLPSGPITPLWPKLAGSVAPPRSGSRCLYRAGRPRQRPRPHGRRDPEVRERRPVPHFKIARTHFPRRNEVAQDGVGENRAREGGRQD